MKTFVFDSSAFLASLYEEKGKDIVDEYLEGEVVISAVNFTEIIEQIIRKGSDLKHAERIMKEFTIKIVNYNQEHALIAAQLREPTRKFGLSLGDRACLALAITSKLPILTADKTWAKLNVGAKIKVIR